MKKMLVLGGTGFIGHHIVRELLERGFLVKVMARPEGNRSLLSGLDVEIVEGVLEDQDDLDVAVGGCDAVIHAGARYPVYSRNPDLETRRGLDQVKKIHNALEKASVERFVYVSTLTAVGKYPDGSPEDENAPYPEKRNRSTYCRLKRAMQNEVLRKAKDFNTVVVAPTAVFGEGDRKPTSGRIIIKVARRQLPAVVSGKTNAVDVRDVARGVALAMVKGKAGRVYVLGGENITSQELIRRMAKATGVKPPSLVINPRLLVPLAWISELAGYILGKRFPLIPLVGLHFALYGEYLSSEVAEKELGYVSGPVDDALNLAVEWFRSCGYF